MPAKDPSNRRRFRFRKRYVPLLLLVALAGGYLFWRMHLNSEIKAELERIRAEGYPATLAELNAWEPPGLAEGNAAEVYLEAFDAMVRDEALEAGVPGVGDLPWPEPGEKFSNEQIAASEAYLAANAKAIDLLIEAARIEACKFPQHVSVELDEVINLYMKLRPAARLLNLHVIMLAVEGKSAEATEVVAAILRLSNSLKYQSASITRMIRLSVDWLAYDAVQDLLLRGSPNSASCEILQEEFKRASDRSHIAWALNGERCYFLTQHVDEPPGWFLNPTGEWEDWREEPKLQFAKFGGSADVDALHVLRWFRLNTEAAKSADAPWPDRDAFESGLPWFAEEAERFASAASPMSRNERTALMHARITITALAAYRYKLDHDRWPDTLDELVGEYLDVLPLDVYNDNLPLRMKRVDDGLLIYSVGDDEVDDGGDGEERADIVFRLVD